MDIQESLEVPSAGGMVTAGLRVIRERLPEAWEGLGFDFTLPVISVQVV